MRCYIPITAGRALTVLEHGWEAAGLQGAYVCTALLGAEEGFPGEVRLCLDVPEEVLAVYQLPEALTPKGCCVAAVPAAVLGRLSRPVLYDHTLFNGWSRRELVQAIRRREASPHNGFPTPQDMRDAMALFDRVGWRAAVRLQERA